MTETEAVKKLCCGPLQASPGYSAPLNCVAYACMAWRWSGAFPLPNDPPAVRDRYEGYCGLAGKQ